MTARRAGVIAVALALGAGAPAARASGQWSVAELAPPAAQPLSLSPTGRLLAARSECAATACSTALLTRVPGGPAQQAGRVRGALGSSAPLRGGSALLVTAPLTAAGLTAADVSPAGLVLRAQRLDRRHARAPAVSSVGGTAVVAWATSVRPWSLLVSVRRRQDAAFPPPRVLARFDRPDAFGGAAVAAGPRGEVAVLWAAGGALHARILPPGARRFGRVLRAGRSDRVARVAAAYTTGGTLAAIWSSADAGEEQNRAAIVRFAALRHGADRFAAAVRLGEGADRESLLLGGGSAVASVAAGRTANVAWTSRSLRVRLGTVHADGSLTAVRGLDGRGMLVAAAGSAAGRALIAWTHDPLGPEPVARAVVRISPARLEVPADAGPAGSRASAAVLADDGRRALVTWASGDPVVTRRWGVAERPVP